MPRYCAGQSLSDQLAVARANRYRAEPQDFADPGADEDREEARRAKRHMDELEADFGGGDD